MREFMDGEQPTRPVICCIEYPFSLDGKASIDGIQEDLSTFFGDNEPVPCLTDGQKSYITWRAR
jgi:hypothetical protein